MPLLPLADKGCFSHSAGGPLPGYGRGPPALHGAFGAAQKALLRAAPAVGGLCALSAGAAWLRQRQMMTSTRLGTSASRLASAGTRRAWSILGAPAQPEVAQPAPVLALAVGEMMIPHPDKADKGGEDALFVSEDSLSLGVADGVGGWALSGVDAGEYARMLMNTAKRYAAETAPSSSAPLAVLEQAHAATNVMGSSTACIVMLEGNVLHAANLGDSGFLIVRQGRIAFRSPQQQHEFNFPYQLGCKGSQSDSPTRAQLFSVDVLPNDILVLGTDGLHDNVWAEESAAVVTAVRARGEPPAAAAAALAQYAHMRAADSVHMSPFAHAAHAVGIRDFRGGKMDDITVVVAYVQREQPVSKL